jgi:hypothetical protein
LVLLRSPHGHVGRRVEPAGGRGLGNDRGNWFRRGTSPEGHAPQAQTQSKQKQELARLQQSIAEKPDVDSAEIGRPFNAELPPQGSLAQRISLCCALRNCRQVRISRGTNVALRSFGSAEVTSGQLEKPGVIGLVVRKLIFSR